MRKAYHHGDLRRALLAAGEAELEDRGLAGFSLRRVAARVGVSHTAPQHHFGHAGGLIEALAERGFTNLLAFMEKRQNATTGNAYERLMGSGLGYLDFAMSHPALFRLVFQVHPNSAKGAGLKKAAGAAFMHLARSVAAMTGSEPLQHLHAREQVLACWTRVHGFAELLLSGYITLDDPNDQAERDAMFRSLFEADFPRPTA